MNSLVEQSSNLQGSAAPQHMLRRHRDILRDYHYEYNRTKDNISRQLNRLNIFHFIRNLSAIDAEGPSCGANLNLDYYLLLDDHRQYMDPEPLYWV